MLHDQNARETAGLLVVLSPLRFTTHFLWSAFVQWIQAQLRWTQTRGAKRHETVDHRAGRPLGVLETQGQREPKVMTDLLIHVRARVCACTCVCVVRVPACACVCAPACVCGAVATLLSVGTRSQLFCKIGAVVTRNLGEKPIHPKNVLCTHTHTHTRARARAHSRTHIHCLTGCLGCLAPFCQNLDQATLGTQH